MAYNIADLFEHAVDAVPERVGLVVDDRQITLVDGVGRSPSGKPDYPWAQRVAVGAASRPTTNTSG